MKKFNGVYECYHRWYDTETGDITRVKYNGAYASEIDFSRNVLKTKKLDLVPEIPSEVDKDAFYINGIPSKDGRISFKTGGKLRLFISKRLVDFLYCSTNQPFRSCYRLDFAGYTPECLKEMRDNKYVYIAYLSQEEMPNENQIAKLWCNDDTAPKMQGRAFLYTNGNKFLVGRPYGKQGFELRDALRRFFPNGLEEFDMPHDSFSNRLISFQNDNLYETGCDIVKIVHDRLDKCFDKTRLYTKGKINWKN